MIPAKTSALASAPHFFRRANHTSSRTNCGLTMVMAATSTPPAFSFPRDHSHVSSENANVRNVLALPSA